MPEAAEATLEEQVSPPYPVHRFTVDQYHQLGEAGVISEADRVELLEGWIVPKMIRNPSHDGTVTLVESEVRPRLPAGWMLRIQSAITTANSEPEPDLVIVRGSVRDYMTHHPRPEETALVIEVADTSLERDRQKAAMYARAGIGIYWIVNIRDAKIEVYSEPVVKHRQASYQRRVDYQGDELVRLVIDRTDFGGIPACGLLP